MTPKHVAATTAALNLAAAPAVGPIVAGAGSGTVHDAARAAARKAGAEAERTRIAAILNHEAAAGRGKLAAHLAFKTEMDVGTAGEMLAASATEGAAMGAAGAGAETVDWSKIVAGVNAMLPGAKAKEGAR